MVFALLSLSVVVVTGYVGQISLAPMAFAGVAGFTVIHLASGGVPFPFATLGAALVATVLGVLVGLPITRVRGMSLAVATLAIAVAIEGLVLASPSFSGGPAGMSAPRPTLFGVDLGIGALGDANFRPAFGFTVLVVLVLACAGVANLRRNRTGLRWLAVRANERAAAAAGIDVTRAKLGAFAVSSFLAGLCGVFMAYSATTLSPTSFMVIGALVAVSLTYLAGVSSISGALVAGALTQAGIFTALTSDLAGGSADDYVFAISGVLLIVTAITAPEGITGLWRDRVVGRLVRPPRPDRGRDAGPAAAPSIEGAGS
jgi:ABC-type branched-subunit amino acid transport system permease subunit